MNSRERVLSALQLKEPDRIPFCELGIDQDLSRRLLGVDREVSEAEVITGECDRHEQGNYEIWSEEIKRY